MEERYGSAGLASEITTCRFWSVVFGVVVRWEAMKFQCEAGITKVKHGAQVLPYWAYISIVYTYMDPLSNPPLGGVVLSDIYFEPWGSCSIWEVLRWNAGTPYMEQCGYADSEVHFGHIDPMFNVKSRAAQNRYQRNIPFAMRDAALNLFFSFRIFADNLQNGNIFFSVTKWLPNARVWKANPSLRCFLDFHDHIQSGCQPAACLPIRCQNKMFFPLHCVLKLLYH